MRLVFLKIHFSCTMSFKRNNRSMAAFASSDVIESLREIHFTSDYPSIILMVNSKYQITIPEEIYLRWGGPIGSQIKWKFRPKFSEGSSNQITINSIESENSGTLHYLMIFPNKIRIQEH